jgi:hypothetical protein
MPSTLMDRIVTDVNFADSRLSCEQDGYVCRWRVFAGNISIHLY